MDKNNDNLEEEVKSGGALNEFLWICAGVNRKVIRQCPTDYAKYAGSGGTILFTALMAMLSGGYAMFFVFHSMKIAALFGLFWGLLIFNLDRYIVNTMYSDGKPTISWLELMAGLPRIIMAIFLGIVISTPLEMKIFEGRIDHQLQLNNSRRANIGRAEASEGISELLKRRDQLEEERKVISDALASAEYELMREGEGSALSGKQGHGPIWHDKEAQRDAVKEQLTHWDGANATELKGIRQQI